MIASFSRSHAATFARLFWTVSPSVPEPCTAWSLLASQIPLWTFVLLVTLLGPSGNLWGGDSFAASEPTFERDVQPLLTRFGCNAGACHGKARGQNGFALSLLGFDADFDYDAIVREGRGRRLFPAAPAASLLLQKATAQLPHGGGQRFAVGSAPYALLTRWIAGGSPRVAADAPRLVRVYAEPSAVVLEAGESSTLRVVAQYSDDQLRDVTDVCAFQSNDATVAKVDDVGHIVAGALPGEAAVMARYMGRIAVVRVSIPLPGFVPTSAYEELSQDHPIDRLVWKKIQSLRMLPSPLADDATFHRRAYLRTIGRLPSPEETLAFLNDSDRNKRVRLIDRLVDRPEYADFWANKWADLLRPNPYRTGMKAVYTLDAWLRDAFRRNMPYDQFVHELVTAQGSTWSNGATVIFRDRPVTTEIGASVSQLFLGVRLECAKCHHHPFEVWSQDDFYGFAAFFARVGHNGGLSPPISGGEELIYVARSGTVKHGRTGAVVAAKTLTGESPAIAAEEDPRQVLANWMTRPDNPFFARVMANRLWAELMGKGLVDPVDDLRATNPASNERLLDYLAADFQSHNYDIKHLLRRIMTSQVFQLSSLPVERNASDLRNFSRYYRQRMRAEVLLDAINDVLGTEESFAAMPAGSRAVQLWTHRSRSVFLDTFGRPDPNQDPPCERTTDSTTPQVLHLMNSPELNRKIELDTGRPAQLAESGLTNAELIDRVYLLVYSRLPNEGERQIAMANLPDGAQRREAVEDLFWALMNTPEFYYVQ